MDILLQEKTLFLVATSTLLSFMGFLILSRVNNTKIKWLRKLFFIPARKSVSDAVQFGGFPLSVAISVALGVIVFGDWFDFVFFPSQKTILKYGFYSGLVIIAYGYIDDKFEIRPVFKLLSQVICVTIFGIVSSYVVFPKFSALGFIILFFWGMGNVNGSNLLDGLDTMTIKIQSVTLGLFAAIGLIYESPAIVLSSAICWLPLVMFYFFNKEPAKIHLGEIGGSFMGHLAVVNGSLVFLHLQAVENRPWGNLALALFPLSVPMVELGMSFLRRIYNKKSPFKGDSFHIHHILKNHMKLSPTFATWTLAIGYLVMATPWFFLSIKGYPVLGVCLFVASLCFCQVFIGRKYWSGTDTLDISAKSLFEYIRKKDVVIIDTTMIDDFQITLVDESEQEEFSEYGDEETDEKAS